MATKRLRGVSVYRPIIYGNTAVLLEPHERTNTDHTHRWTVGVRSAASPSNPDNKEANHVGGADDLSYFIKKVTFKLHETYAQPLRTIERPPFEVTETGWGEFDIVIKIFFVPEAAEKPLTFNHHLKLHPWPLDLSAIPPPVGTSTEISAGASGTGGADKGADADDVTMKDASESGDQKTALDESAAPSAGGAAGPARQQQLVLSPIHSWQYEEVVFVEPVEQFYAVLLAHPPTPLPANNRHPKVLKHQLGIGGNFGEFSQQMESDERDRMEQARLKVAEEADALKKKLIEHEKELQALKKEVEDIQASQPAQPPPVTT
ncbi:NuA4 histone H4 acetyltransferase complex and the SWR1 complex subunit [Microbotryomycetes sp. JL201]|nr:NuA4 histone H4 acetyltransferase complex and the SWR1 complex subunit [Microbotryomycetes sp. JL201]